MYFAIFYVYNALHGATLANCSHFQYVSRLRLRVIRIGVKAYIDVTLYHLHNRETFPYSTKDNFDRCPVIYNWIPIVPLDKLMARYTIGLVYSMAYFTEPMVDA